MKKSCTVLWALGLLAVPSLGQELLYEIPEVISSGIYSTVDLNGDGVEDLQVGFEVYSGVDGELIFVSSPPDGQSFCKGMGDMDGDGYPDVRCVGLGLISVYSGLTQAPIGNGLPCAFWSNALVSSDRGDINGDGVLDLCFSAICPWDYEVADYGLISGQELVETGSANTAWCKFGAASASPVAIDDYSGDGVDDMYIRNYEDIRIRSFDSNNASSSVVFVEGHTLFGIADVDGDGQADLLTEKLGESGVRVLSGDDQSTLLTLSGLTDVALAENAGDFNCDGHEDVFVAYKSGGPTVVYSGKDGSVLWQLNEATNQVGFVNDLNGDGTRDFAIRVSGGGVQVWAGPRPEVSTYCQGKLTSQGCTPKIGTSGTPTNSGPDDFLITSRDSLKNSPGLFFWGSTGAVDLPFMGGTLCVQPPLQRGPIVVSSGPAQCQAGYAFLFSQSIAQDYGIAPGSEVNGQFWMRDSSQADGTGVSLSDGVQFNWCP